MGYRPPGCSPWVPAAQACRCICIAQPEQWPGTPALSSVSLRSPPIHFSWKEWSEGLFGHLLSSGFMITATGELPKSDACEGNACPDPT